MQPDVPLTFKHSDSAYMKILTKQPLFWQIKILDLTDQTKDVFFGGIFVFFIIWTLNV